MIGVISRHWLRKSVAAGMLMSLMGCGDHQGASAPSPTSPGQSGRGPSESSVEYREAQKLWSDEITAAQIALADCLKTANATTDPELREKARNECRKQFEDRAARNDERFQNFKKGIK